MSQTKSRNGGRKNTSRKPTPDLIGALGPKKRGPGRPPKHTPAPTADQIAESIEAHANQLLAIARDLRS